MPRSALAFTPIEGFETISKHFCGHFPPNKGTNAFVDF
jgi:hypothetical protein